jgi:hypothetical protein
MIVPPLPVAIAHALVKVRRRLRAQRAIEGAAIAAVGAAAALAVLLYLVRLRVLDEAWALRALVGALALVAIGALAGALRRVPLLAAAARIDGRCALSDRVTSALSFAAEPQPTPFMQAAIADAAAHADRIDPRRAAPLRWPDAGGAACGFALGAAVLTLLWFPPWAADDAEAARRAGARDRLVIADDLLESEKESVRSLVDEARRVGDPEVQKLAEELQQLLQALDRGDIDRQQMFDKLATIDEKLRADSDRDFEVVKRKLKAAGGELGRSKLGKETGKALAEEDLAKARKELEKLAAEAERLAAERAKANEARQAQTSELEKERARQELARALEKAAEEVQKSDRRSPEEKRLDAEEQRLREEQRRLKREQEERPNDEEVRRKLQRNQRELERLEREKQKMAAERRELERLERELRKAAEEMRKKLSPEQAEALRKLAEQLGKMENEIKKLGNAKMARVQIAELKEVLRRAGRRGGRGQEGQGQGGEGQEGQGKNGQGQGQDGRAQRLRDFNQRAKGGAGGDTLVLGGKSPGGGDTTVLLPLPMGGGQGGQKGGGDGEGGDQPGQKGQGQDGDRPGEHGDGVGNQHDPNLYGRATELAAKHKDSRVSGREGAGPTTSETILGSAERGFATRSYKKVYSDYHAVAEEVMTQERVPPGYRYFVERYFKLIKPRE